MASYLPGQENDYRIYQVTPFLPDRDAINRALMYRQTKYDEGVARVQGVHNDMLGLDISNMENKERLSAYMTDAKKKLNQLAKSDFSVQDNVNAATNIFEPITKDKYILNDVATTKFYRQQFKTAETMKTDSKTKGEGYNATNVRYVQNAYEKFVTAQGDAQFGVEKREYTPYVDVMKEINKVAQDMKVDVIKDSTAPGGYIIKQKNGSIAYGPLLDMFNANLSDGARNQLRIESTVGYEDAVKVMGEPVASAEVAHRYSDGLNRQKATGERQLAKLDTTIKEIEALGDAATVQQQEYLETYKSQRGLLDDNIKNIGRTIQKMGEWTPEDIAKFAPQLANELYTESRAHNWARSYADATESTTIGKNEAYWANMEYNRNVLKDERDYQLKLQELEDKRNKNPDGTDKKRPGNPMDPNEWTPLGPSPAEDGNVTYGSLNEGQVAAVNNLAKVKRVAMDEYWDKKAGNGSGTYSVISKAVSNGNTAMRLSDLVKAYNNDPEMRNNISLDDYGKMLGVSGNELENMTVKQVYDRMNSGFGDYLKNAESVPSGDLNPYKYKLDLQQAQELHDYYVTTRANVNSQAVASYNFKPILGSKELTEKAFVNPDGTVKPLSQVKQELSEMVAKPKGDQGVSIIGNAVKVGRANPAIRGFTDIVPETILDASYARFAKAYDKERDLSAKTLSKNVEFNTFSAENDPKNNDDVADQISRKLVYNFNGVNTALFAGQFTPDELKLLKQIDTDTKDIVSSVEMTPTINGSTNYTIKFSPEKLINGKYIDDKSSDGAALVRKLASGVVFKGIKNIPELDISRDVTKFLVDSGKPVERSFGDGYSFRIKKIGNDHPSYTVQGTKLVPDVTSDGKLIKENGMIKFKRENIEETLDPTRSNLDEQLRAMTNLFYQMNAMYIYAQRADVVNKKDTDPGAILTREQLISAATQQYKLKNLYGTR